MIDPSRMRGVRVDPTARTARAPRAADRQGKPVLVVIVLCSRAVEEAETVVAPLKRLGLPATRTVRLCTAAARRAHWVPAS